MSCGCEGTKRACPNCGKIGTWHWPEGHTCDCGFRGTFPEIADDWDVDTLPLISQYRLTTMPTREGGWEARHYRPEFGSCVLGAASTIGDAVRACVASIKSAEPPLARRMSRAYACRVCAGNGETGMERDCPACGGTGVSGP